MSGRGTGRGESQALSTAKSRRHFPSVVQKSAEMHSDPFRSDKQMRKHARRFAAAVQAACLALTVVALTACGNDTTNTV